MGRLGFPGRARLVRAALRGRGHPVHRPSSATIRQLGDKLAAKRVAERAGVPVVPWSGGSVDDLDQATAHAARLGYSLVLRAAAGGGGRGIRIVHAEAELAAALGGFQ